jgi:hypothetical protein
MSDLTPRQAIEQWQNKQLNGTALMRALISYAHWSLPISEKAVGLALASGELPAVQYSKDALGITRLYLFSGSEAYNAFAGALGTQGPPPQHFIDTTGSYVYQLPFDSIDEIVIDPASPWEIRYKQAQFERLHELARAVEIERTLAELRAGTAADGAVARVKNYKNYTIVLVKTGEGVALGLAPDDRGRALAALFTCDDALEAYLEETQRRYPDSQLLTRSGDGAALLGLLTGMKLDGIVFNCSGPGTPVAFALQFAAIVGQEQA